MNKKDIPEYRAWKAMKARCYAPSNKNVGTYQKNNIEVCDEWRNDFEQFFNDMGKRPSDKHSLDRIDNLKGYSKENCRWATQKEQCSNRGTFNRVYTYNNESFVLKEWAERLEIDYSTLHKRITRNGMTFERACYCNINPIYELSIQHNIPYEILYDRIHSKKWNIDDAINKPIKRRKNGNSN